VLDRAAEILGRDAVDESEEERRFLAQDALGRRGETSEAALPLAVLRPETAEQVARVLALASETRTPIVPYGAGTGLMGGARSERPGLVLDTSRLNQIDVRAQDRFVWAGAGAILKDVDAALREHGLCLGHDPWTFPVASVAGPISTNGLGYMGGRYGGMGDQMMALEVALSDGTLLRTRAVRRRSTGPDLARLFVGAEGTMGVITAAALQAFAVPEERDLRAFRFASFEAGFRAIDEINRLGMRPSLLDYGEGYAAPWPDLSTRQAYPPTLYLGFEGFAEEVEASMRRALRVIAASEGEERPQSEAQAFWDDRHVVAERFARSRRRDQPPNRDPNLAFDYMHVALPPSQTLPFRERCIETAAETGAGVMEFGLWLGPELFSASFTLPEAQGGREKLRLMMDGLLRLAQDMGGSMEYVHGAGSRLAPLMQREHGSAFELLQRVKTVLDPYDVINPGKLGL